MLNTKNELRGWVQIVLIVLSSIAQGPARAALSLAVMVIALGTLPEWKIVKEQKIRSIALYFGSILLFGGCLLYNAYEVFWVTRA